MTVRIKGLLFKLIMMAHAAYCWDLELEKQIVELQTDMRFCEGYSVSQLKATSIRGIVCTSIIMKEILQPFPLQYLSRIPIHSPCLHSVLCIHLAIAQACNSLYSHFTKVF